MIKYTDSSKPNSTAIRSVFYDSETESMHIIYNGGTAYRYDNVNYESFESIAEAESAGKAVNAFKLGRTHPGGVYMGTLFDSDFESREEDDNMHSSCLSLNEHTTLDDLNNVTDIFTKKSGFTGASNAVKSGDGLQKGNTVYLASKNLTMPTSTNTYEVEFRMDLTGDRTFSHFTKATSIEDAISKLSIISDALEAVLTILSVKVIYERN